MYLAWKLAEKGEKVTVFEKKDKIGKEACSGLFSERILKFIPQSQKLIENKIESVLIHFPKKTLNVKFSKKFLVMNHAALDRLVADLAQKAGAEIILNRPVHFLPQGFDRIVGCDGADSIVREKLGLKNPRFRLGILGFVPEENSANFVETWPIKNGFIWKIPRGRETEYGVLGELNLAKKLFTEFLEKNHFKPERITSALVLQGLAIPKNKTITLCGDAAGLTKPWSGGGVIWGLTAAEMLSQTFPNFLKYQREMKKFFLPQIILSQMACKMVYFLGFKLPWLLPKKIKIGADFTIFDFMIR